jgi:hypothetical protein
MIQLNNVMFWPVSDNSAVYGKYTTWLEGIKSTRLVKYPLHIPWSVYDKRLYRQTNDYKGWEKKITHEITFSGHHHFSWTLSSWQLSVHRNGSFELKHKCIRHLKGRVPLITVFRFHRRQRHSLTTRSGGSGGRSAVVWKLWMGESRFLTDSEAFF